MEGVPAEGVLAGRNWREEMSVGRGCRDGMAVDRLIKSRHVWFVVYRAASVAKG